MTKEQLSYFQGVHCVYPKTTEKIAQIAYNEAVDDILSQLYSMIENGNVWVTLHSMAYLVGSKRKE